MFIEKKDRGKRLIKTWPLIFPLKIHVKVIFKVLEERITERLPSLVSPSQTMHVEKIFIGQRCQLIFEILEITESLLRQIKILLKS